MPAFCTIKISHMFFHNRLDDYRLTAVSINASTRACRDKQILQTVRNPEAMLRF